MGLRLTLSKENNSLFTEFKDAYWVVTNVSYSLTSVSFNLICYPSREARHLDNTPLSASSLPIGGASLSVIKPELYRWRGQFAIAQIFPNGIPINPDEQIKTIYSFVKSCTGLSFDDVLEDEQEATI